MIDHIPQHNTNRSNVALLLAGGFITLIAIIVLTSFTSELSKTKVEAMMEYEQCVVDNYHMTPLAFKELNGVMPQCNNDTN